MAEERVQPISLHQEMQRSYLEYAMSVIVGRALPDVRDGLKPVQRRILYAMHELGLTPDRPYRKCARVVGDVLGKYHPHGDQAVYDALVRLVQTFSSRNPLLDGHGNFGSVDNDPPAAMRYTETRLAPISHAALLEEIGEGTVDFSVNFDGSQQEPAVLPAQLPFLLLNGCSGIAVGMATNIPPHNLGEVVDALVALVRQPQLSDERLLEFLPGPDFPTGGEVLTGSGLRESYLRGRGSIPMRGVAHVEEVQPGKGRHRRAAVVVTELPYQLSKAGWIERLAQQVNEGRITGIADIRDESDREGLRVVVELRRDAKADQVLEELQRRTALQSNFGAILLALVGGHPRQLSLRQLLEHFLEYRELTLVRRTRHALRRAEERLEVVEGLIKALDALPAVIDMIQSSRDAAAARASLQVHLDLNERQADAVLAMPLRRITSLEQGGLRQEAEELIAEHDRLRHVLDDRPTLLKALVAELKSLRRRYATPRRTRLVGGGDALASGQTQPLRAGERLRQRALDTMPSDGQLLIQSDGLVRILSPNPLSKLHLTEACEPGGHPLPAQLLLPVRGEPSLLAFTESGRVAILRWEFAAQKPDRVEAFLPEGLQGERVVSVQALPGALTSDGGPLSFGLLSSDGHFKRISLELFHDLSGRATSVLKLKPGVSLSTVVLCREGEALVVASSTGRMIRVALQGSNLPLMGKSAQGSVLTRLLPGETVVGAASGPNATRLALTSARGQMKTLCIDQLRSCQRGDLGEIGLRFRARGDQLVSLADADNPAPLGVVLTGGRSLRVAINSLRPQVGGDTGIDLPLTAGERVEQVVELRSGG